MAKGRSTRNRRKSARYRAAKKARVRSKKLGTRQARRHKL